jgi:hypothetical protein
MFNHNSGYSLSDIAAVSGRNGSGMFGDDNGWWIILLLLFAGGAWGGNGWGGNGNASTTREEIAYGFSMNGLTNDVRGVQQGLCDGFYAVNTGMLNGFAGVNNAITSATIADMQNTNAITAGITGLGSQLAQCCCDNRYALATGFADVNYNLASQACDTRRAIADSTRDIIASNEAGVRSILDFLTNDKIATLTAENQSLKFAASQANQNAFIVANQEAQTAELIRRLGKDVPVPAYVVPNPNCCYTAPYGGCGLG